MSSPVQSDAPASAGWAEDHAGWGEGRDDSLVVAFTAPWCGHCRAMLPQVEAAAARPGAPGLVVVDVSRSPDLAERHRVSGTPTLVGFVHGTEVARMVGRKGPSEVGAFVDALAAGSQHRRSLTDLGIRSVAAVIVGVAGLLFDATPLVVFAGLVLVLSGASEWRSRRA